MGARRSGSPWPRSARTPGARRSPPLNEPSRTLVRRSSRGRTRMPWRPATATTAATSRGWARRKWRECGPRRSGDELGAREVRDRLLQPRFELYRRLPFQHLPGERNVRLALLRVVARQLPAHDLRARPGEPDHLLGELEDGGLAGIAQVDRPRDLVAGVHEPDQRLDQVVHVAEGARLRAVTVDRERLALERLHDEVRHHAPVVGVHARAERVEDARHLDAHLVLAVVVEEERLGAALALVVARAHADRIHVAPVALDLRMDLGVAVDLRGRRLQDLRLHALGETEHVDRAVHARLGGLHRVELVVDRGRGAREVVDLVHAQDVAAGLKQALAQVRADEPRPARDHHAPANGVAPHGFSNSTWPVMRPGFPTTIAPGGTDRVTTAPAPMTARSPMTRPGRTVALAPIEAPLRTIVRSKRGG